MRALGGAEPLRRGLPAFIGPGVPRADRAPACQDRLRHIEWDMTPAELLARTLDLFLAKRRAVGRGGTLLSRSAIADDGPAGDERRPVGGRLRILQGERDRLRIVAVDPSRMPARRTEALELVVRHRQAGRAVDGNL